MAFIQWDNSINTVHGSLFEYAIMSVCVCIKGGNLQRIPLYTSLSKGTTVLVFQGRNIFSQRQCFINICIHIIHGFMGQNTPVPICLSGENLCYCTTARRNMLYMLYSVVVFLHQTRCINILVSLTNDLLHVTSVLMLQTNGHFI